MSGSAGSALPLLSRAREVRGIVASVKCTDIGIPTKGDGDTEAWSGRCLDTSGSLERGSSTTTCEGARCFVRGRER